MNELKVHFFSEDETFLQKILREGNVPYYHSDDVSLFIDDVVMADRDRRENEYRRDHTFISFVSRNEEALGTYIVIGIAMIVGFSWIFSSLSVMQNLWITIAGLLLFCLVFKSLSVVVAKKPRFFTRWEESDFEKFADEFLDHHDVIKLLHHRFDNRPLYNLTVMHHPATRRKFLKVTDSFDETQEIFIGYWDSPETPREPQPYVPVNKIAELL